MKCGEKIAKCAEAMCVAGKEALLKSSSEDAPVDFMAAVMYLLRCSLEAGESVFGMTYADGVEMVTNYLKSNVENS